MLSSIWSGQIFNFFIVQWSPVQSGGLTRLGKLDCGLVKSSILFWQGNFSRSLVQSSGLHRTPLDSLQSGGVQPSPPDSNWTMWGREKYCPQRVSHVPPLLNSNQFSVLEITEPKIDKDTQESDTLTLLPTEPRKPCQPKWEKRMKWKLIIHSLELGPKSIMLQIHLKTTDTMEESSTEAMVDTRPLETSLTRILSPRPSFQPASSPSWSRFTMWTEPSMRLEVFTRLLM